MDSILVTGVGGPAGMATIQSLRAAPERLRILGVDMDPLAPGLLESDKGAVVPACSSPSYVPSLLTLCSRYKIRVVIPTVDEEVSVLAQNRGAFERRGVALPIPSPNAVRLARDKLRIAEVNWPGVDVPQTVAFESAKSSARLIARVGLPCVAKQRVGRGGRGFAIVESAADAKYLRRNSKTELVLQEKVDGDILLVQGLVQEGRLLAAIVHRRLAVKAAGSGTAIAAVTVRDEAAVAALRTVARRLDWEGAIGVEFINKKGTRRHYMIDINPRICGQSHLSTMAGLNLAYGLVQLARGMKVTIGTSYRIGLAYVRTWKDVPLDYDDLARLS